MLSRRIASSGIVRSLQANLRCTTSTRTNTRTVRLPAPSQTQSQTQTRTLAYASVNHAEEYKEAMEGRHGQQLQLAYKEGAKYENEVFNPFEAYRIDVDDTQDEDLFEGVQDEADADDDDGDGDDLEEGDEDDDDDDEEDYEEDAVPTKWMYNKDGSTRRTKAELVSLKAGAPAGGKFAIINLNSSQQKVTVDDVIILDKLRPVEIWAVGTTHTLTADEGQLLLMGSPELTLVGLPFVNGGEVDVMVEEITRDKKVIIFKKKRRKNYRRKNGFKRDVTFLRVLDIRFPEDA